MYYEEDLFHDIRPLTAMKTAETATGDIGAEGVGSIIFKLKINGKKIVNTLTDVEYVPDLTYNLIATGLLKSNNCEVNAKNGKLTTGTRQHVLEGDYYIR